MRAPDHERGPVRAWRLNEEHARTVPDHDASLGAWMINGPFHPFWHWWMLAVVHLRDLPNVPPAAKHYPEAEYELLIMSLNPERGTPDVDAIEAGRDWGDESKAKFLTPPDVVKQFHGVTDAQAIRIGEDAIRAIMDGHLSPDQDYRSAWGHAIDTTVEHLRTGKHPEPSH